MTRTEAARLVGGMGPLTVLLAAWAKRMKCPVSEVPVEIIFVSTRKPTADDVAWGQRIAQERGWV